MPQDRRYIGGFLSSETHEALIRMGTQTGREPHVLINEYIVRGIRDDLETLASENREIPVELRVFQVYLKTRRLMSIRHQLMQIAAYAITDADSDAMDQLRELCEPLGISTEELMNDAARAGVANNGLFVEETNDMMIARTFLYDMLKDGSEVPFSQIENEANVRGIVLNKVKAAKRLLGVRSIRKSHQWVWMMGTTDRINSTR